MKTPPHQHAYSRLDPSWCSKWRCGCGASPTAWVRVKIAVADVFSGGMLRLYSDNVGGE